MDIHGSSDNRPALAAVCALAGMFLLGFTDNFLRVVAEEAGLWQFHAFRSAIVVPILIVAIRLSGVRLRPLRMRGVVVRSLAMGLSMLCYFGSLAILPISVAVAGFFAGPIFVLILTATVLRRRVGPWRWSAAVVGFAGILLVIQPRPDALQLGLLLPFLAGFLYAVTAILTREWCAGENVLVLTLGAFLAMLLLGVGGLAVLWAMPGWQGADFFSRPFVLPSGRVLAVIAMQAVGAMSGVGLLFRAYQLGEASFVAIFEYSLIIFAAFWAWILWSETQNAMAFAGIGLIFASGAVIALRSGSPRLVGAATLAQ